MKTLTLLFALLGTVRYCSRPKEYKMPAQKTHHNKLIASLQADLQSTDSLQKTNAEKFVQSITTEYSAYNPDNSIVADLKNRWNDSISVKVIGGNWCSDTRRELPRLCKLLDAVGANADLFGYYKVDRDKKPVQQDFAAEQSIIRVPTVFVFRGNKLVGQIVETPMKSWESDLRALLFLH